MIHWRCQLLIVVTCLASPCGVRGQGAVCVQGTTLYMTGRVRYADPGCDGPLQVQTASSVRCANFPIEVPEPAFPPPGDFPNPRDCTDRPLRGARAELWEDNGIEGPSASDRFLVSTTTDDAGLFAFCRRSAPDAEIDLYVRVALCSDGSVDGNACGVFDGGVRPDLGVVVTNPDDGVFNMVSATVFDACTGHIHWEFLDRRGVESGAAAIFDLVANDAMGFFRRERIALDDELIQLKFPTDRSGFSTADLAVHVAFGDRQDPDVVLRSLGFSLLYRLRGRSFPAVTASCASAQWGAASDTGCAWVRGFAMFLQAAIQDDPIYEDTPEPGEAPTVVIDLEAPTPAVDGEDDEGTVAAVLWDLVDEADEPWESSRFQLASLWPSMGVADTLCHFFNARELNIDLSRELLQHHGVDCMPLVVNIVTHGFNPNPLDWVSFRRPWRLFGQKLDAMPPLGSELHGRVRTYVSEWDSSRGFWTAFVSLLVAKVAEANARVALSRNELVRAELLVRLLEEAVKTMRVGAELSQSLAETEASKLFLKIRRDALLDDEHESRARQKIHLIGHSRGAAINARLSQLLTENCYNVVQYTSLDGFSVDWPSGGGRIGDIDINSVATVSDPSVGRKRNYLVETDLVNYVVNELEGKGAACAPGGVVEWIVDWLIRERVTIPIGNLVTSQEARDILRQNDLRAPHRPNLQSLTVPGLNREAPNCLDPTAACIAGTSHHLNILQLYACSDVLPIPSFVTEDTEYVAAAPLPERDCPRGDGGGGVIEETGDVACDFVDGSFERLGERVGVMVALSGESTGDDLLDGYVQVLSRSDYLLEMLWKPTGDVTLISADDDTWVELTAGPDALRAASIAQPIVLTERAKRVEFEIEVLATGDDDVLELRLEGEGLGELPLTGLESGRHAFPLGGVGSRAGELRLQLRGSDAATARIRLDDLRVVSEVDFLRGDCNEDANVDISDAVCTLEWLFLGRAEPGCVAAANTNGDEAVDISDPVSLLGFLFLGGPAPPEPFLACGTSDLEADRGLGCRTPPNNCQQ